MRGAECWFGYPLCAETMQRNDLSKVVVAFLKRRARRVQQGAVKRRNESLCVDLCNDWVTMSIRVRKDLS
jgi:hypothetical protein